MARSCHTRPLGLTGVRGPAFSVFAGSVYPNGYMPAVFAGPGYMVAAELPSDTNHAHLRHKEFYGARSTELAEPRGCVVANGGRDARRLDEHPRPRRALQRRHAEALVGRTHDADVRRGLVG